MCDRLIHLVIVLTKPLFVLVTPLPALKTVLVPRLVLVFNIPFVPQVVRSGRFHNSLVKRQAVSVRASVRHTSSNCAFA